MQKMDQYYYYRSWMYDRTFPRRTKLKPQFEEGIHGFVAFAMSQTIYEREGGIRCLCLTCLCLMVLDPWPPTWYKIDVFMNDRLLEKAALRMWR